LLRSTFQLVAGIGPHRERRLWSQGVTDWQHVVARGQALLPAQLFDELSLAIERAERFLGASDLSRLAALVPRREHWRFFQIFAHRAISLDIEMDADTGITVVGLLDQSKPRLLLAGRDLDSFPAYVDSQALLLTFNGAAFDLPRLMRAFPDWVPPAAHVDLRHLWARLKQRCGLKELEDRMGIGRPDHLRKLDGSAAAWMWRHAQNGDKSALRALAEYNLYDVVNLPTLLALGYNRMKQSLGLPLADVPVPERGPLLYDISRILLSL